MRRLLSLLLVATAVTATPTRAADPVTDPRAFDAAQAFLATLTADQRGRVVYAFDDDAQRARWSNFPTGFVPRGGLSIEELSAPQRDAAMTLLAAVLSPMGLEKVEAIRRADDDFKANGSRRGPPGGANGPGGPNGGRGGPPPGVAEAGPGFGPRPPGDGRGRPPASSGDLFGRDLYFLSFVGAPSATKPWMLQFGGHHLALNVTIVGGTDVMTPSLTGAQPEASSRTAERSGRSAARAIVRPRSSGRSTTRSAGARCPAMRRRISSSVPVRTAGRSFRMASRRRR